LDETAGTEEQKDQGGDNRKIKGRETLRKLIGKLPRGGTEERATVRWCKRCMNETGESEENGV
jgi:hypothetical protein